MEDKVILTTQELWDFVYKEICKNLDISKAEFAMSNLYLGFKKRFYYFINRKRGGKEILGARVFEDKPGKAFIRYDKWIKEVKEN